MVKRKSNAKTRRAQADTDQFDQLDRVIHEKARLEIMTTLATQPKGIVFSDLKTLCNLTDGNLNRHLKVLTEAELVIAWRSSGRKPQTMYRLTELGSKTFARYLDALEAIVQKAQASVQSIDPRSLRTQMS